MKLTTNAANLALLFCALYKSALLQTQRPRTLLLIQNNCEDGISKKQDLSARSLLRSADKKALFLPHLLDSWLFFCNLHVLTASETQNNQ